MKIAVCIKQVPGSNKVSLDPETHTILRESKNAILNPYDLFAVEMAIAQKQAIGARTIALSMGIPSVETLLRDTLARGIDEAYLLSDRQFAGADTLATSYALAQGLLACGPVDLVLCGKMAVDGDTAQIGPELAETLGIPHISGVVELLELTDKVVRVRQRASGYESVLEVALPALLALEKDVNIPRMPSIAGIRDTQESPIPIWSAKDVKADPKRIGLTGSPTQVVTVAVPPPKKQAQSLPGTETEQVQAILEIAQKVLA